MIIIHGDRRNKYEIEMNKLDEIIPAGFYVKFKHPFPEFMSEPGSYYNNMALIGKFHFKEEQVYNGNIIIGTAFEFIYIRDDRVNHDDPTTKHINVDCRMLWNNPEGSIVQCNYKPKNHFISPVLATSFSYMEGVLNIQSLDDVGHIDELKKRGIEFKLDGLGKGSSTST